MSMFEIFLVCLACLLNLFTQCLVIENLVLFHDDEVTVLTARHVEYCLNQVTNHIMTYLII